MRGLLADVTYALPVWLVFQASIFFLLAVSVIRCDYLVERRRPPVDKQQKQVQTVVVHHGTGGGRDVARAVIEAAPFRDEPRRE